MRSLWNHGRPHFHLISHFQPELSIFFPSIFNWCYLTKCDVSNAHFLRWTRRQKGRMCLKAPVLFITERWRPHLSLQHFSTLALHLTHRGSLENADAWVHPDSMVWEVSQAWPTVEDSTQGSPLSSQLRSTFVGVSSGRAHTQPAIKKDPGAHSRTFHRCSCQYFNGSVIPCSPSAVALAVIFQWCFINRW